MGAPYVREYPFIKEYFDEASEAVHVDILDLCLNAPEGTLNLTVNAQPAILVLGYSAFQIVQRESDVRPFLMAGHSLGEITALCCSGAIGLGDAVNIVRRRGELMQLAVGAGDGAMMAVNGLSLREVEKICASVSSHGTVVVSNINSTLQIVISGEKAGVDAASDAARLSGAATLPLSVSAPFHSPFMKPAAIGLESELNSYVFAPLTYPVMSNVTCRPYWNEHDIIPLLTEQMTTVVNWQKIMEYVRTTCVTATLELPPKKILTKLFQQQKSGITSYSFDQREAMNRLSDARV
jgi:[acyl-carrier-protein] S-malonyltransferase